MHLLSRLLNRQPATDRLDRWVQPRANRTPELPPIRSGMQTAEGETLELDLRDASPSIRRVRS